MSAGKALLRTSAPAESHLSVPRKAIRRTGREKGRWRSNRRAPPRRSPYRLRTPHPPTSCSTTKPIWRASPAHVPYSGAARSGFRLFAGAVPLPKSNPPAMGFEFETHSGSSASYASSSASGGTIPMRRAISTAGRRVPSAARVIRMFGSNTGRI